MTKDDRYSLVAGAGVFRGEDRARLAETNDKTSHNNAYVYWEVTPECQKITFSMGVSANFWRRGELKRNRVNPKIGVLWNVTSSLTVRFAAFDSMRRQLIGNESIEPTQVTGFNQFFDDFDATLARRVSFALDSRPRTDLHTGFELSSRRLRVPFLIPGNPVDFVWRERGARGYFYWTTRGRQKGDLWTSSFAFSANYYYERLARAQELTGFEGIRDLTTSYIPLGVSAFMGRRLSGHLVATYVKQSGTRSVSSSIDEFATKDQFVLTDAWMRFGFPRQAGSFNIGIKNLFDKRFEFVDTDPLSLRFAPRRFVFARLILIF